MSEEEKKAAAEKQAAEAAAAAEKEKESFNYKAELEKTQKELEQAQFVIEEEKKKNKALKKANDEAGDQKISKEDLDSAVAKQLENFKLEQSKNYLEETLSKISDPDERALVKLTYENKLNKSGFTKEAIESDIQNARILANKPKLEKTLSELKISLVSKHTTGGGSASGHDAGEQETKLSDSEEAFVKRQVARGYNEADVRKKLLENKTKF